MKTDKPLVSWKDMPDVEHVEEELYKLRHDKKACKAEQ